MEYLPGPPRKGGCGYRPGRVATGGPARLATSWNSSASSQASTWLLSAFTHRGLAKEGTSIAGADGRVFDGPLLDVVDQRLFLALAGTRIASMNAASAGDTWRRPG